MFEEIQFRWKYFWFMVNDVYTKRMLLPEGVDFRTFEASIFVDGDAVSHFSGTLWQFTRWLWFHKRFF